MRGKCSSFGDIRFMNIVLLHDSRIAINSLSFLLIQSSWRSLSLSIMLVVDATDCSDSVDKSLSAVEYCESWIHSMRWACSSTLTASTASQGRGMRPVLNQQLMLKGLLAVPMTTRNGLRGTAFPVMGNFFPSEESHSNNLINTIINSFARASIKRKLQFDAVVIRGYQEGITATKRRLAKQDLLYFSFGKRCLYRVCLSRIFLAIHVLANALCRKEKKNSLLRTVTDLFRLVPFAVFVVVPFMELLLPVALKLFPGMLPSTFESANEKEAKMKKTLKMKIEMAKFLQKTLDNMPVQAKERSRSSQTAKDFTQFYDKVQTRGGVVSNEEIMNFSKLFEDEITLDSLTRPQLVALCKMLEMQSFGTNNFLRFQIRLKVRALVADDKTIQHEGVGSLAVWELQQACKSRGMRAYGLSKQRLQSQLKGWLELSLDEQVPISLLLMSRMLFVAPEVTPESLAATISTLPEEVATMTRAKIGKSEGKIDNKTRLDVIRSEEKKIKEDKQELMAADLEKKKREEVMKKKTEEEAKKREAMRKAVEETQADILATATAASMDSQVDLPLSTGKILAEGIQVTKATVSHTGEIEKDAELLVDRAPVIQDKATVLESAEVLTEDLTIKAAKEQLSSLLQQELTAEDLHDVEEALEFLGVEKKQLLYETKELAALKAELASYKEHTMDFKQALVDANMDRKEIRESKAARRLFHKVNKMIGRMDPLLTALSKEKDSLQKMVDAGDAKQKQKADLVSVEELITHMSHVSKAPDISKVEMIRSVLERMDEDKDGAVKVEHVMRVLELMTADKVGISPKLFEEVIEMMAKEQQMETTKLIARALESNVDQPEPPVVEVSSAESTSFIDPSTTTDSSTVESTSYDEPSITNKITQPEETYIADTSQTDHSQHTEKDTTATKEDSSELSLNLQESLEDSQKNQSDSPSSVEEERKKSQLDEAIIHSSSSSSSSNGEHSHKKEVKQSQ
ncbi:unnamed protein product, partial [Meganyctiphanes norvegica]